jgi:hypothetical protein
VCDSYSISGAGCLDWEDIPRNLNARKHLRLEHAEKPCCKSQVSRVIVAHGSGLIFLRIPRLPWYIQGSYRVHHAVLPREDVATHGDAGGHQYSLASSCLLSQVPSSGRRVLTQRPGLAEYILVPQSARPGGPSVRQWALSCGVIAENRFTEVFNLISLSMQRRPDGSSVHWKEQLDTIESHLGATCEQAA